MPLLFGSHLNPNMYKLRLHEYWKGSKDDYLRSSFKNNQPVLGFVWTVSQSAEI